MGEAADGTNIENSSILDGPVQHRHWRRVEDAQDKFLNQAVANSSLFVNGLASDATTAVQQALTNADKAKRDAARTVIKAANDGIDAVNAAERFAERQVKGIPDVLSAAQKRVREGKVVDAIWHIGIDQMRNTNKNASQLTQESELANQVAQGAAATYGGPGGAAAYAAWKTYNDTHGNVDLAIKAGMYAAATSEFSAGVGAMPTGTISEVGKKAAVAGALGGLAVAASGGSNEDALKAFVASGGAVIVQSGQAYVQKEYVDPKIAEGDAYCTKLVNESCSEGAAWVVSAKATAEQALKDPGGTSVQFTGNHEWAISWNKYAFGNEAGAPAVALTYVGEGSPYFGKMQEVLDKSELSVDLHASLPDTSTETFGWVYLGEYLGGTWKQPRSNELAGRAPEEVSSNDITLTRDVNVRTSAFHVIDKRCNFDESPIIGQLRYGTTIRITKIYRLPGCTSYVWAEIHD
ncbi:hypothetical protein Rleg4DRAFT_1798 [Rhizobium leguminosarum bv. trifolii WSM2297]|uniref:Uncharacterized protein n=1 Tax=Rhizobium leguminosarum bv. trifolii WSM2297 TaxID=754762 RepID=J0KRJ2_RHILT|nr:hypothetical protein [Rhizobium leguminosarum]EJC80184.1 hypothetical protein Rleg4DRAFT_1798 [Rhizobium leguminosarum bv. trifolii WSM2297]